MLKQIFLNHPRSVDETYFEHMMFAMRFSWALGTASLMAIVHAFIPCLFEKSASLIVADLYDKTSGRGKHEPSEAKTVTSAA